MTLVLRGEQRYGGGDPPVTAGGAGSARWEGRLPTARLEGSPTALPLA